MPTKRPVAHTLTMTDPFQYPHHPLQSWRDRWVKYVSNRPRPNLPEDSPQPDAGVRGSPRRDSRPVDHPPQSQAGPSNVHTTPVISPTPTPKNQAKPQGRIKFTKEDDEILLRTIRETRKIAAARGEDVKLDGNKIFQDLEAKASQVSRAQCHLCVYVYIYKMSH